MGNFRKKTYRLQEFLYPFACLAGNGHGVGRIKAFHLNDTRALLSSHRENHEHWGRGRLGSEGLKALLDREEFSSLPGILETPLGGREDDRASLEFVRRLSA